ncbi:MAG: hypothetical protein PW735_06270 [Acidobacteriaceae bacterium]|nr:hypothetical protein [Acidobacteriaceae bacterium]
MKWGVGFSIFIATISLTGTALAEQISVRHLQLPMHRFMVARTEDGKTVASGEFSQTVQGDEVTMHFMYRFVDGSLDDETTTYSQSGKFQLVRTHHIQIGPFFAKPVDFAIDAASGTVTIRTPDRNGKTKVESRHMTLPVDLANGFVGTLLLNVSFDTKPFRVDMLAPVGGGKLIQLLISPTSQQTVQLDAQTYKATVFRVHPELGTFVGLIARLIGLQPKDVEVWVLQGDDPAVAVVIGQLGGNGPVISSDLVGNGAAK